MDLEPSRTYTFIGDIHGQAPTLRALLEKLNWKRSCGRLRSSNGEKLVFVGDLIDGGKHNLESVELVRELVDQGDALCLMGNHEFNAVHFHTEDPSHSGQYLRPHDNKNREQHREVLDELEKRPHFKADMLAWFKGLPVAVEGPGWRCVHACWHEQSLEVLDRFESQWFVPSCAWFDAATKGSDHYVACETLMKGPETRLPRGAFFLDSRNIERYEARVRWWARDAQSYREALLFSNPPRNLDLSERFNGGSYPSYPSGAPPVFFGHYWMSGPPELDSPNAVCVDYSAGRGEHLVAYRHKPGEQINMDGYVVQKVVG